MVTDGLHCRLLTLARGDFGSVARTAQRFGRPITRFDQSPSIVAWDESISFEAGNWSWASGIASTKLDCRIAVFHMGSLPGGVGVFGIISGFSSLSNAARNYIMRPFRDNHVNIQINLSDIAGDRNLQNALVGYSYEADGVFHTVSRISLGTILLRVAPVPSYPSTIHSVRLKAAAALTEVDKDLNLSLTAEAGAPEYAIEDSRQVFEMIAPHLSVLQS